MQTLSHVLLPCKMTSTRIERKNLQRVGGVRLLDVAIRRFREWHPQATIWIATEDEEVKQIANSNGCRIYPLTDDDLADGGNVISLFSDWVSDRTGRCCCTHLDSPFLFRSELQRAIDDGRSVICAAWMGPVDSSAAVPLLSQQRQDESIKTGNFLVGDGGVPVKPNTRCDFLSPVSWLSAMDVDTPENLKTADLIARWLPWSVFDDLRSA